MTYKAVTNGFSFLNLIDKTDKLVEFPNICHVEDQEVKHMAF